MNKLKVYKTLRIILVIIAIVLLVFVIRKFYNSHKMEKLAKDTISQIVNQTNEQDLTSKIDMQMNGYKVVGIIRIPKIELEYPILEKTTIDSLNVSITKFWGNELNEIGNVAIAGHNNLNGTMFGKTKKLEVGDIIEITDIQNITLKYEVFKKYVTDPNDISCIKAEEEGTREITLITCTNGRSNRLILKAREIK